MFRPNKKFEIKFLFAAVNIYIRVTIVALSPHREYISVTLPYTIFCASFLHISRRKTNGNAIKWNNLEAVDNS